MTLAALKTFLLWSLGFHTLLLTLWFFIFVGAHDWMYRLHTRWFQLSVATFDTLHYAGMGLYKLGIWLAFGIPCAVIYLMT